MYVRLDAIQPRTEEWVKKSWKEGKWSPNSVINSDGELVDARVKGGLRPSPVTRDLQWGVPVPIEGDDEDGMRGKVLCRFSLCIQWYWFLTCFACQMSGYVTVVYCWCYNADHMRSLSLMLQ